MEKNMGVIDDDGAFAVKIGITLTEKIFGGDIGLGLPMSSFLAMTELNPDSNYELEYFNPDTAILTDFKFYYSKKYTDDYTAIYTFVDDEKSGATSYIVDHKSASKLLGEDDLEEYLQSVTEDYNNKEE